MAIRGLCDDLQPAPDRMDHEVFVQAGPGYYYTGQKLFMAGTHPLIRVKPAIPLLYATRNWDFGWVMLRTDGRLVYRRCDPYTLEFNDVETRRALRWFVRE